jgi:hypothetical protein
LPGTERTLSRARDAAARAGARLTAAPPLPLLAALCAAQLAIGAWIALTTTHNHFVWYSGGDATEYWTGSWSLAHGQIGQTIIGYGVPVLWAWVPLVTGTTLIGGLPVIASLQWLVLVPLALVLLWAVADLLFGRLFAWWAAVLWVAGPPLLLAGFSASYRGEFENLFLAPHWFGLTDMADLPSLVVVLATAWSALRLLERRTTDDAVLTGLLAGALIGIKPANGFFLPALALVLVAVRRLAPLAAFAAGFVPALVTLALWKERGLGSLPVAAAPATREAAPAQPVLADTNTYLQFDWSHLQGELHDLGNVFWSVRLLEFLAIAGALAALRRSTLKGAFLVLWFLGFCLVKGSSARSAVVTVSYWRFVEPGLPAFVLLVAAIVYLVPRSGRAFAPASSPVPLAGGRRTLGVAATLLAVVPLLLLVVARPASSAHYARIEDLANDAPLTRELKPVATAANGRIRLNWAPFDTGRTRAYYGVYRSASGNGCTRPGAGAQACIVDMDRVGVTRSPTFVDKPGPGPHWYRIALLANFRDALDGSDLMLLGPATPVRSAR